MGCNCQKASKLTVGTDGRVVVPAGRIIYQVNGGRAVGDEKFDPAVLGGSRAALDAARARAREVAGRVQSVRA